MDLRDYRTKTEQALICILYKRKEENKAEEGK